MIMFGIFAFYLIYDFTTYLSDFDIFQDEIFQRARISDVIHLIFNIFNNL